MDADSSSGQNEGVLAIKARRVIFDVVQHNPGCHFREIQRRSRLSTGSTHHHLGYLQKQGMVKMEKESNAIRYFPLSFNQDNKKIMALLRQKSLRRILLFLAGDDPCTHREIVAFTKLSPSTVSWHLKRLESAGAIKSAPKGRNSWYSLTGSRDQIVRMLIAYRESFLDTLVERAIDMWGFE